MMTAKTFLALTAVLLATTAVLSPAIGVASEFLFSGYSQYVMGEPDAVGSTMDVYGILTTVGVETPIWLDTDNYQDTVLVSGMVVTGFVHDQPTIMNIVYGGGEVQIFKDPIVGGTAADWSSLGSFVDGEMILHASVDPNWTLLLFDFDLDMYFTGSGSGSCDFDGGSQLGDIIDAEYYLNDWGFFGTPVADENPNPPGVWVPDGFERVFGVKLIPPNDPTPDEPSTWGQVKGLYR